MSDIQFGNYSSCCRLCLSERPELLDNIFGDVRKDSLLPKKIQALFSIEVHSTDKKSTLICTSCVEKIDGFVAFKKICSENQYRLDRWIENWRASENSIGDQSFQIKDEVPDIYPNETIRNESQSQPLEESPVIQVKDEPLEIEDEMPSLLPQVDPLHIESHAENDTESNSDEISCEHCNKNFANKYNLRRHYRYCPILKDKGTNKTIPAANDDIVTENDSAIEPQSNKKTSKSDKNIDEDPQKIEFAAGLKLVARDATNTLKLADNLTKMEIMYLEKAKSMMLMFKTLRCTCHNNKYSEHKTLYSHLRKCNTLPLFPGYTCFNCMIFFNDRSASRKHSYKNACPYKKHESLMTLSNLKKRSEHKSRIYQCFECRDCGFDFTFHHDLLRHYEEMHCEEEEAPFKCLLEECDKEFSTAEEYKAHIRDCLTQYYCDICFESLKTQEDFIKHAEEKHDNSSDTKLHNPKPGVVAAKKRPHSEATPPKMERPVRLRRSSMYQKAPELDPEDSEEVPETAKVPNPAIVNGPKPKGPVGCTACGKMYASYHSMLRHFKTHVPSELEAPVSDDTVYCCPDCGAMCKASDWERHKQSHPKKKCVECNKVFQFQHELDQHRSVHLNLKVYRDSKTKSYKSTMLSPNSENGVNKLTCSVCNAVFKSVAEIAKHKLTHESNGRANGDEAAKYHCADCNKSYASYQGFWEHNKNFHGPNETPKGRETVKYPKKCDKCSKILATSSSYSKHQKIHKRLEDALHNQGNPPTLSPNNQIEEKAKPIVKQRKSTAAREESEDYHTCKKCFKVFSNKSNLRNHMKMHGIVSPPNKSSSAKQLKSPKKVWCDSCHIAFNSPELLQEHKDQEHDEMPDLVSVIDEFNNKSLFTCDICVKTFSSKSALKKHKDRHAEEASKGALLKKAIKIACKYCKILFDSEPALEKHMFDEHDEKKQTKDKAKGDKFPCRVCKKVFHSATALNGHVGWHNRSNTEKNVKKQETIFRKMVNNMSKPTPMTAPQYQCTTCLIELPNDTALQIHILEKHRNVNAFAIPRCVPCNQEFKTQDEYDTHKRLHELVESQKLSLKQGSNSFERPPEKTAYKRNPSKSFPCQYCPSKFSRGDTLKQHERQFHGNELTVKTPEFHCNQCDRVFDKQTSLTVHLKVHETSKAKMKQTVQVVTQPKALFFCSICNMGFNLPKDLRTHTINAHPF